MLDAQLFRFRANRLARPMFLESVEASPLEGGTMQKALWLLLILGSLNACVPLIAAGAGGAGAAYWATQTESGQKTVQNLE
jgi:hypothetical protein